MERKPTAAIIAVFALVAAFLLVGRGWAEGKRPPAEPVVKSVAARDAVEPDTAKQSPARPANPVHKGKRLREGAKLIEVTGRFDVTGDRLTFVSLKPRESLVVLENLALERVNQ